MVSLIHSHCGLQVVCDDCCSGLHQPSSTAHGPAAARLRHDDDAGWLGVGGCRDGRRAAVGQSQGVSGRMQQRHVLPPPSIAALFLIHPSRLRACAVLPCRSFLAPAAAARPSTQQQTLCGRTMHQLPSGKQPAWHSFGFHHSPACTPRMRACTDSCTALTRTHTYARTHTLTQDAARARWRGAA
jgi:hypothetical protein